MVKALLAKVNCFLQIASQSKSYRLAAAEGGGSADIEVIRPYLPSLPMSFRKI